MTFSFFHNHEEEEVEVLTTEVDMSVLLLQEASAEIDADPVSLDGCQV